MRNEVFSAAGKIRFLRQRSTCFKRKSAPSCACHVPVAASVVSATTARRGWRCAHDTFRSIRTVSAPDRDDAGELPSPEQAHPRVGVVSPTAHRRDRPWRCPRKLDVTAMFCDRQSGKRVDLEAVLAGDVPVAVAPLRAALETITHLGLLDRDTACQAQRLAGCKRSRPRRRPGPGLEPA
jgi:hypothetical protein